jgi:hypothetical protein
MMIRSRWLVNLSRTATGEAMSSHEPNALGNPAQTAPPAEAAPTPAEIAPVKKMLLSLTGFRWWIILTTPEPPPPTSGGRRKWLADTAAGWQYILAHRTLRQCSSTPCFSSRGLLFTC